MYMLNQCGVFVSLFSLHFTSYFAQYLKISLVDIRYLLFWSCVDVKSIIFWQVIDDIHVCNVYFILRGFARIGKSMFVLHISLSHHVIISKVCIRLSNGICNRVFWSVYMYVNINHAEREGISSPIKWNESREHCS